MAVKSGQGYIDKFNEAIERNRYLVFFAVFQMALLIILAYGYLTLKKDLTLTVELPPKLYASGTIKVGSYRSNRLFYDVWGRYLAMEAGNYNPKNIDRKILSMEKLLSDKNYVKYHHAFLSKADEVKENVVEHEFEMIDSRVEMNGDQSKGVVTVHGFGWERLGNGLEESMLSCTYTVGFSIVNYHLFLDGIKEDCKKIAKETYEAMKKELEKKRKGEEK